MQPRRNHRLVLETPVRVPDGGGGWTIAWEPRGALWGEIEPRSAREPAPGARPAAQVSHRIVLRAEPGRSPRPEERLRLGERVFSIQGVAGADPLGAWLALWVEEGALP